MEKRLIQSIDGKVERKKNQKKKIDRKSKERKEDDQSDSS